MPTRSVRMVGVAVSVLAGLCVTGAAAPATSFGPAQPKSPHDNVWGGYVAQGSGFTSVSGSWTEPQVTCNSSNDLFAPWVGIDGYGSQTVEQTGVETNCESGAPDYRPWYEMYPAQPVYWNDPVDPGDSMTGSVEADGAGTYTLTLTDNTKGWTETTRQQLDGQNVSAEAVIESPTQSYPSFSQLDFSGITVNGQSFDSYNPTGLDSGGYTPGPLSGGSFSMTPGGGWRLPSSTIQHGAVRY